MPDEQEPDARFTLANERTFLAWTRTSLALIGGGLAVGQLVDFRSDLARIAAALPPVVVGSVLAVMAYLRWQRIDVALRRGDPIPQGPLRELAVGIVTVGVIVAVVLVVEALDA